MIFKKDNFVFGLVLGFVAPIICFIIYKYVKFKSLSVSEMFEWLKLNPNLITVAVSLSLLANAVLFTLYINANKDKTARGIFAFTCIYAIGSLLFKFLA
jgi:hypothetical protein